MKYLDEVKMRNSWRYTRALAITSFVFFQVWWIYLLTDWIWLRIILSFSIGCSMVWTLLIGIGLLVPKRL